MNRNQCLNFLFIILASISVGLFGGSFKTLSPLHAGLKINTISQSVSTDRIYTGGRYFVGLGNDFITYPTTLQTIDFSSTPGADASALRTPSAEGQTLTLEISFQFRLNVANISQIYRSFAKNYRGRYVTRAQTTLQSVARLYSTADYFEKRGIISNVMHAELKKELEDMFAIVEHFQLRSVSVPASTDTSIQDKLVKQQNIEKASVEQRSSLVRSDINAIVRTAEQRVVVINAEAENAARETVSRARALATTIHLNATAQSLALLRDRLGFNSTDMLHHLFLENLRSATPTTRVVVDMPSAMINV